MNLINKRLSEFKKPEWVSFAVFQTRKEISVFELYEGHPSFIDSMNSDRRLQINGQRASTGLEQRYCPEADTTHPCS